MQPHFCVLPSRAGAALRGISQGISHSQPNASLVEPHRLCPARLAQGDGFSWPWWLAQAPGWDMVLKRTENHSSLAELVFLPVHMGAEGSSPISSMFLYPKCGVGDLHPLLLTPGISAHIMYSSSYRVPFAVSSFLPALVWKYLLGFP